MPLHTQLLQSFPSLFSIEIFLFSLSNLLSAITFVSSVILNPPIVNATGIYRTVYFLIFSFVIRAKQCLYTHKRLPSFSHFFAIEIVLFSLSNLLSAITFVSSVILNPPIANATGMYRTVYFLIFSFVIRAKQCLYAHKRLQFFFLFFCY